MAPTKGLRKFVLLEFLGSEGSFRQLPFILFLGFLAILCIANAHFSEKKIREIQVLQDEIRDLRWEYMTLAAENRVKAQRSYMAERFAVLGLEPFRQAPQKLAISPDKSY